MTLQELAEKNEIVIDYSDDDIIIVDNIKKLTEPNPTRIKMNMVSITKKGKAQASINGVPITFGENQLLISPPNTTITDLMFSADFEFRAIFLTSRIIQSFLRDKMNIWNEMMYIHKMHVVTLNPRDIEFVSHFYEALKILMSSPEDYYPYRTECIQGLLRSVLLGLCGVLSTMMPETERGRLPQAGSLFQRFLNLLANDKNKAHTVEHYASQLCITPKYLSAVCKKNSGKSANAWIKEHMIEEIRYYLKQTDLSMKQIANQLGFPNPSFFGKYVKEHFGMTPRKVRTS